MKKVLVDYLDDFLKRGDSIAYVQRRGLRSFRWTYRQVGELALSFSRQLNSLNIEKGDRVLLCAHNSAEWVAAFFACLHRGAIAVPLDVQSDQTFVKRIEDQTEAKVAFLDGETSSRFQLNLPVLLLDHDPAVPMADPDPYSGQKLALGPAVSDDDVAEIVFTSGTSSDPKGVQITNRNLLSNLIPLQREIERYLKWEPFVHPIRFLNLLPLSHIFGQFMGVLVPQLLAGEVFFHETLNASQIISTVKRERISVIVCVPRLLEIMRERIQREYDAAWLADALHSAKNRSLLKRWWVFRKVHLLFGLKFWAFICGGATLSPELEEFWNRLGFVVIQGYGMTETASLISVNHPFKRGRGSIGKIMPGQEVKLAADGEILIRGANVSPGYWRSDETGARDNGWFPTGDLGEFDKAGHLYFKGRKKDVIVTAAGMNVYPEDIELVLRQQPEVKDTVVIPFSSSRGPEPFAVLSLNHAGTDAQEIINRVNEQLPSYQRLYHWSIWPEPDFPRTSTGKIKKKQVSDRVAVTRTDPASAMRTSGLEEIFARVSGEVTTSLDPSANLATDLKLDSLGRVELLSELEERYQLEIDEGSFSSATTVGDVERIIRQGKAESSDKYPYPRWAMRIPFNVLRILLLYLIVFPLVRFMGTPRVVGFENISDIHTPLLFIANHFAKSDHALVLWALPGRFRRRMSIAMDGELLREWLYPAPGTGWFTGLRLRIQYFLVVLFFNVFAMPQHGSFRRSFAFAGEMIEGGNSVLVFPEGHRSPDGLLQRFKPGIGLLINGLAVPVVPVRLDGLVALAQQRRKFARPGEITIRIGEPVTYPASTEPEAIAQDLQRRVAEL
jgi:long-chain acyl-CoA synthetase